MGHHNFYCLNSYFINALSSCSSVELEKNMNFKRNEEEYTYLFFQKGKDILVTVENTVLFVTTSKDFDVEMVASQEHYLTSFDGKTSRRMLKHYENIEVTLYRKGWKQIFPTYEDGIELLKGRELFGDTHRDDVFSFLQSYGQLSGTIDPSFALGENWD